MRDSMKISGQSLYIPVALKSYEKNNSGNTEDIIYENIEILDFISYEEMDQLVTTGLHVVVPEEAVEQSYIVLLKMLNEQKKAAVAKVFKDQLVAISIFENSVAALIMSAKSQQEYEHLLSDDVEELMA